MIRIASTVLKLRIHTPEGEPWLVSTVMRDDEAAPADIYLGGLGGFAATHTEALQLAEQQRQQLAEQQMDAVHESRATRRAPATTEAANA